MTLMGACPGLSPEFGEAASFVKPSSDVTGHVLF